jgi:hypothetical protein
MRFLILTGARIQILLFFLVNLGRGAATNLELRPRGRSQGFRGLIFRKSHGFRIAICFTIINIRFLILTGTWIQI